MLNCVYKHIWKRLNFYRKSSLPLLIFVFGISISSALAKDASKIDHHLDLFSEENYPSASQCAVCHQKIYKEWASSNHAYSSISPMFHKFEQAIYGLTQGTIGSFCVRCHQQVGTQRNEPREAPLWERSQVAREGVTCITCHRISEEFGKVNGERRIVAGDIHAPVLGSKSKSVFSDVIKRKTELKIATDSTERGAKAHSKVIEFAQISKSEFCVSCHQVAVNLGIKLEVVWDQYRDSPAAKAGVTCQDCHMGKVPGVAAGYEKAPVAVVGGEEINPNRDHHNHAFYGPGYPIAHPGIFPHNPDSENWSIREWLKFDWRAGWGKEEFEEFAEIFSESIEGIDESAEAVGASTVFVGFESFDQAIKILSTRLASKERMKLPLKEASEAIEKIGEALEYEDPKLINSGLEDHLEALGEGIDELEGKNKDQANNALAALKLSVRDFKGTWANDKAEAMHEHLTSLVQQIGNGATEDDRKNVFNKVSKTGASLRKLAASGITFYAKVHALKSVLDLDFPEAWSDPDDREEAREVVDANLEELEFKKELRKQVMNNGGKIDGPFFTNNPKVGKKLSLKYIVTNTNSGHNLPSGSLGAQPEIWMNVALINPDGENVWESGYVDSYGDFADNHSLDLAAGKIEFDDQLFNLQTKFLTTNIKGTDREMYLPVNFDIDQRPFLRPAAQPTTVINHPPFIRMEGRSIPPLGKKEAKYTIPASAFKVKGKYKLAVRMRSRAEPIYFMKFVGATEEMIQSMNQWMLDIHPYTVEFEVN